jgi:hypothetical protein
MGILSGDPVAIHVMRAMGVYDSQSVVNETGLSEFRFRPTTSGWKGTQTGKIALAASLLPRE